MMPELPVASYLMRTGAMKILSAAKHSPKMRSPLASCQAAAGSAPFPYDETVYRRHHRVENAPPCG